MDSFQEIIILELDFAKAFDTVEHFTILDVMKHIGFPELWLKWIQMILFS